jgi:hypothetical protein
LDPELNSSYTTLSTAFAVVQEPLFSVLVPVSPRIQIAMYLDFSAYPMVVKTDYSYTNEYLLCQDLIDQTYFANVYTSLPDRSLETCLDYPYLEKSGSSVELPSDLDFCPAFCPVPLFSELRQRPASSFNRHPAFDLGLPISPNTSFFFASPLCSDEIPVLASPTLSLSSLECETPKEATLSSEDLAPKQPQRKRGRPKLEHKISGITPNSSINACSSKHRQHAPCQLHKQAERKYRQGLNSYLERLRRVLPTLSQSNEDHNMRQIKPSKLMVLSCAIDCIEKIENERDRLRKGNEQLGGKTWRNIPGRVAHD